MFCVLSFPKQTFCERGTPAIMQIKAGLLGTVGTTQPVKTLL